MINQKHLQGHGKVWFAAFAAVLGLATGYAHHADRPPQGNVSIAAPGGQTVYVIQDDYVYYPYYQVYYSSSRHQYAYREGNTWVARPAPQGVRVEELQASPSVRMNFHDSPANHHAAVEQEYPKNWKPANTGHGQQVVRKSDQQGNDGGQ